VNTWGGEVELTLLALPPPFHNHLLPHTRSWDEDKDQCGVGPSSRAPAPVAGRAVLAHVGHILPHSSYGPQCSAAIGGDTASTNVLFFTTMGWAHVSSRAVK
jgi:hypothetical protein